MIISMTGFGVGRSQSRQVEIEVTIKALNGRFLEVRSHLPREYVGFDRDLKRKVGEVLLRGTVDVYVQRRLGGQAGVDLEVNRAAAKKYADGARRLLKDLGFKEPLSPSTLLSQPEVMVWKSDRMKGSEGRMLMAALEQALKECVSERKREGKSVAVHLKKLFARLHSEVQAMSRVAGLAREEIAKRLESRLTSSPLSDRIEPGRIQQELAIYLDRSDVEEELHRLREHLRQCQDLIQGTVPPGKKLDFYTQELQREVNTVGSKSALAVMTRSVVEAKALIEQIKEQVQNII